MRFAVLDAMERLSKYEKEIGRSVLRPVYLFVQKYGRSMETKLEETAEAFGKKKYFLFRKERGGKTCSLLDSFLVEAQKRSEIGKRFNGFVLAELTGEEEVKERVLFYEYIKENLSEITCMFTVKDEEAAEVLQKELEQQFSFVRTVHEECYSPAEQKDILMAVFEQSGAVLTEEAESRLEDILAITAWKPTDHVENVLRNLANNLVYEQIMKGNMAEPVPGEKVQEAICRLEEERGKNPIGFAPPAVSRNRDMACLEIAGREMVV